MLACQGTIIFAIVEKSITDDLPTNLAWKKLKKIFNPQTSANKLKLKRQFTNSNLTDWKKDPDDWITELDILQTQLEEMGHTISDKDLMIHILNNFPTEYKSKVASLVKDLDNEDCPLTLAQMTNELNFKYKKICKKNEYDPESGEQKRKGKNNANDTALIVRGFKGFRGRCHFYGNFGHEQSECPFKSSNENQKSNNNNGNQNNQKETPSNATNNSNDYVPPRKYRFNGKYDHCRKWGHRKEDCWILKRELREKQESEEVDIMCATVPNDYAEDKVALINEMPVVKNKNLGLNEIRKDIWIADSGALSHMTNDVSRLINQRKIKFESKNW